MMKGKTMTLKQIPEDILKKYKLYCVNQGISMNADLIQYMELQGKKLKLTIKK